MRKRSIMLVPPRGTHMRVWRVPPWAVFALILAVAAGVAGYFTPLDRLILTEQELAQKKSLEEQNERLQNNIGATLRTLSDLRERTGRIEAGRERYGDVIGLPRKASPARPQKATAAAFSSSSVLRHIGESEKLLAKFTATVGEGGRNLFDTIPVIRPVPAAVSAVSMQFGPGLDPFTGRQKMHYGVDLAAEMGTPVTAAASGVVTRVENDQMWGRRVTIEHGRGFRTVYAHLGTVRAAQGKAVRRGEEIGTVGMTGLATGPHLHYEVWHGDRQVNPEEYFFPVWAVAARE